MPAVVAVGTGVAAVVVPLVLGAFWLGVVTSSFVYALAVLSVVVLHRASQSVSLCQAAFLGIGAYTTAWLFTERGWPFLAAAVVGALVCAPVGVLLALPAIRLRLRGLELSVLTLCFGFAANALIFSPTAPLRVTAAGASLDPAPSPLGIDLNDPAVAYVAVLVVTSVVFLGVWSLLRSPLGATWQAMRAGNAVAEACGIRVVRATLIGFAVSAVVAGVAGAMLITLQTTVTDASFSTAVSLFLVVVATAAGIDRLGAAVVGGFVLGLGQQVFSTFGLEGDWLSFVLGIALVAVVVSRNVDRGRDG